MTPADSGEYVCRVVSGSGTQEASVLVTIQQRRGPTRCECPRVTADGLGGALTFQSLRSDLSGPWLHTHWPTPWLTCLRQEYLLLSHEGEVDLEPLFP